MTVREAVTTVSVDELKDIYNKMEEKDKTIHFLINLLLCSGSGLLKKSVIHECVATVCNHGAPDFSTFVQASSLASNIILRDLESGKSEDLN